MDTSEYGRFSRWSDKISSTRHFGKEMKNAHNLHGGKHTLTAVFSDSIRW